jgi:hypothetical protein
MSGTQCHLRLWYACFEAEFASEPDAALQAIFDTGHQVGELATQRYPGGVLIETAGPAVPRTFAALLAYCGQDTLAMVELRRVLAGPS